MSLLKPRPELWAGVECTVNRVGDAYFDQLERNGHALRLSDLAAIAELGVQKLRFPAIWERIAPNGPEHADWRWLDLRLERLRELGIQPIVGFVHHGSGPPHTSLLDPGFCDELARYSRAFAERYPWVEWYTPVNEPLTTARFSGLYGCWYPHGCDDLTFARALLNQCRAVVAAMRQIRAVNPSARLVQTEDLGRVYSTQRLAYQAEFENERRWLTWDLLCGRVDRDHPLWSYFCWAGVTEPELEHFLEHRCTPDVVGLNHYLTSERFLDHRLGRYPAHTHGGNRTHRYADVEAVRVRSGGVAGPHAALREAWDRYRLPVALTEVHLGCTREEQLRWFHEAWDAGCGLRREGVPVLAVTAWSLLGTYDWDTLLTCDRGHYESGVFDLRAPQPRPTVLARWLSRLADGEESDHPLLDTPGWWRRPERLAYPRVQGAQPAIVAAANGRSGCSPRPLLITGGSGTLGRAFAWACVARGIAHRLPSRPELDVADAAAVNRVLDEIRPWAIVNAAGYVRVDDAEREPAQCRRANAQGPAILAAACAQRGIPLLTFSSDLVFDGERSTPYLERDPVQPLNTYGRSKAEAEVRVLAALPSALVVRTSAFFGPWDDFNFVTLALRALAAGQPWIAADDAVISPTYVPDLVHASLDLLIDGEQGIWHLANSGALSWVELARAAAESSGIDTRRLEARPTGSLGLAAPRPAYSVLGSERGLLLPPLEQALSRYCAERAASRGTASHAAGPAPTR